MKRSWGLSPLQRSSVIGGIVLLVVVGLAIALRMDESILKWFKAFEPAALFAVALVAHKRLPRATGVVVALGLSALGDLLLTGCLPVPVDLARLVGMGMFALAYVALTIAFWRPLHAVEWAWLVPFAAVGGILLAVLWPSLGGIMYVAVPVFVTVIVAMAWTLGLAPRRHFLRRRVAWWTSAGGLTLLGSDAGVAFAMFAPPTGAAWDWLDVYVTTTYFVGWLLLTLVVIDPAPVASAHRWDVVTPVRDARASA